MWNVLACVCVLCVSTIDGYSPMYRVFMEDECGKSQSMSSAEAIKISMTIAPYKYDPNEDCTFRLSNFIGHQDDRYMIQFRELDIRYDTTCSKDWLSIYDGRSSSSSPIGKKKYCGSNKPSTIYTSSGVDLTFYFHSSADSTGHFGFEIIVSKFTTGPCSISDITCANGRCISTILKCNGYNPCGDDSDCPPTSGDNFTTIVGSVVGVFMFICLCMMVAICLIRKYRPHWLRRNALIAVITRVNIVTVTETTSRPEPQPFTELSATQGQNMTSYPPPEPQPFSGPIATQGQNMTSYPPPEPQPFSEPSATQGQNMTTYPPPPPYPTAEKS